MQFPKYLLITALILFLVIPEDVYAWRIRIRTRRLRKRLRKVWRAVKKPFCKALFGIICPAGVVVAGAYLTAQTAGTAAKLAIAGAKLVGKHVCKVQKKKCKRSALDANYILIPFSDNFDDYDLNGDKMIEFDEFMRAVTSSVGMVHPEELMEPFVFADADGNDMIDSDEFQGAPFVFGELYSDALSKYTAPATEG